MLRLGFVSPLRSSASSIARLPFKPQRPSGLPQISLLSRNFHLTPSNSTSLLISRLHSGKKQSVFYQRHPNSLQTRKFSAPAFLNDSPQLVVLLILGVNSSVWFLWQWAAATQGSLWEFMNRNFLVTWSDVKQLKLWKLITPLFSHASTDHFLFNMFTFYFVSSCVATPALLGPAGFLALYLGGGITSLVGSQAYNYYFRNNTYAALGASGAIYATLGYLACAVPNLTLLIFGVIPTPAWLTITGIFAYDLYSHQNRKGSGSDHLAHMIGLATGGLTWLALML